MASPRVIAVSRSAFCEDKQAMFDGRTIERVASDATFTVGGDEVKFVVIIVVRNLNASRAFRQIRFLR